MTPIKIQVDHNGTHARAYYMLILSLLRVNHGLKLYNQAEPTFLKAKLAKKEWQSLCEQEAVLKPSTENIIFMQTEQHYTAAFRSMSIDSMLTGMRAETFQIVDLDKVGHGSKLPRTLKSIRDFTNVGKVTRKRAILETERRYC